MPVDAAQARQLRRSLDGSKAVVVGAVSSRSQRRAREPALEDFRKPEPASAETSRAVVALQAAATSVSGFGEGAWDTVNPAADVFRSVDLDGDGVPDEARALTAAKGAGAVLQVAAAGASGTVGAAFRRRRRDAVPEDAAADTVEQTS
ncbi:hypothetical protein KQI48_12125 [Cellulomonas hominis]|uniref:hypothetical protein n=1 Tax=Cellulomonas hominis TaxID=156981 RepID=UPI001C127AC6|nr:hypothetical protein [Cellulomonas hominis]MBU5423414.1 hypothetical protein [Cellulomonas hominis]